MFVVQSENTSPSLNSKTIEQFSDKASCSRYITDLLVALADGRVREIVVIKQE